MRSLKEIDADIQSKLENLLSKTCEDYPEYGSYQSLTDGIAASIPDKPRSKLVRKSMQGLQLCMTLGVADYFVDYPLGMSELLHLGEERRFEHGAKYIDKAAPEDRKLYAAQQIMYQKFSTDFEKAISGLLTERIESYGANAFNAMATQYLTRDWFNGNDKAILYLLQAKHTDRWHMRPTFIELLKSWKALNTNPACDDAFNAVIRAFTEKYDSEKDQATTLKNILAIATCFTTDEQRFAQAGNETPLSHGVYMKKTLDEFNWASLHALNTDLSEAVKELNVGFSKYAYMNHHGKGRTA